MSRRGGLILGTPFSAFFEHPRRWSCNDSGAYGVGSILFFSGVSIQQQEHSLYMIPIVSDRSSGGLGVAIASAAFGGGTIEVWWRVGGPAGQEQHYWNHLENGRRRVERQMY